MDKNSNRSKFVTETQFPDHTVIVPPNRLERVIKREGDSAEISTDALSRGEAALAGMKGEFVEWMNRECEALENSRETLKVKGASLSNVQIIFRAALDVKGQAPLFGYPLAATIATSLCHLISSSSDPARIPISLIDRHIDAVRAVVREGVQQRNNKTGRELSRRLAEMVEEYLAENALPQVSAPKL